MDATRAALVAVLCTLALVGACADNAAPAGLSKAKSRLEDFYHLPQGELRYLGGLCNEEGGFLRNGRQAPQEVLQVPAEGLCVTEGSVYDPEGHVLHAKMDQATNGLLTCVRSNPGDATGRVAFDFCPNATNCGPVEEGGLGCANEILSFRVNMQEGDEDLDFVRLRDDFGVPYWWHGPCSPDTPGLFDKDGNRIPVLSAQNRCGRSDNLASAPPHTDAHRHEPLSGLRGQQLGEGFLVCDLVDPSTGLGRVEFNYCFENETCGLKDGYVYECVPKVEGNTGTLCGDVAYYYGRCLDADGNDGGDLLYYCDGVETENAQVWVSDCGSVGLDCGNLGTAGGWDQGCNCM